MNRLQHEKSPYLLQHDRNPVNWYPWSEEAFAKARQEDKPVFLSIGYATCHWCHVMAHESFEDDGIAALMNAAFVNIKVDREERPDIDSVYMHVCQGLTGGGGWPLTIVMTPDKEAFFAGTYFPRDSYAGRIGMRDLVERIDMLWKNEREQILGSARQIQDWLRREVPQGGGDEPGVGTLKAAFEELQARYDWVHGGFGTPKFPTPHHLTFLMRYYKRFRDEQALAMVEKTLMAMREGGIYDHVGGGFHRYATDERWFLPHFEKMLYDQAQLVMAYTEAYQVTGKAEYAGTAREIIEYVMRDLRAPEGAFYCAEDADSEGVEGKFYVWTEPEIRAILDEKEVEAWVRVFGVELAGNYQDEASRRMTGGNIFFRKMALAEVARDLNLGDRDLGEILENARRKLLDARTQRIRPRRDDKILCDWNGLMIAALAKAAQVFEDTGYAAAAREAADFILAAMRTPQGGLLHRWRDGEAGISGFLEDYAFFVWGLIELYEATFEVRYLESALDLNTRLIELFRDEGTGGFYQSASDDLVRRKDLVDGALPSGNSVAALNLVRLGRLTGQHELEALAVRIGESFSRVLAQMPSAFTQYLSALDFLLGPSYEIVVAGMPGATDTTAMLRAVRLPFMPSKSVLFIPSDEPSSRITALVPFTEGMHGHGEKAAAYVCTGNTCQAPMTDVETLRSFFDRQ